MRFAFSVFIFSFLGVASAEAADRSTALFDQGKLLATGGVTQIEGAGGAGLSTWALITGYGSERGVGINAHHTYAKLDDFSFNSSGIAVGLYDRLELSYARQWFDTESAGGRLGLGEGFTFTQDILGAKLRLVGDAIYTQDSALPQVSLGVQYKNAGKSPILAAVGASRDEDIDIYLTATKAYLQHSLIASAAVRRTRANHFDLLGFGGVGSDSYSLQFEGSLAYMLRHNLVLGGDYRTKPDNLAFAEEGDSKALYIAWFPSKLISFTVAVVDLGPIALQGNQQGIYFSVQAGF